MDKKTISELFARYKEGNCTAEEIKLLHRWLMDGEFDPSELSEDDMLADLRDLESMLPMKRSKPYSLRRMLTYAASVALILGFGYGYQALTPSSSSLDKQIASLEPGSNKAILKLGDGSSMTLDIAERDSIIHIDGS